MPGPGPQRQLRSIPRDMTPEGRLRAHTVSNNSIVGTPRPMQRRREKRCRRRDVWSARRPVASCTVTRVGRLHRADQVRAMRSSRAVFFLAFARMPKMGICQCLSRNLRRRACRAVAQTKPRSNARKWYSASSGRAKWQPVRIAGRTCYDVVSVLGIPGIQMKR
jgi:hypothetical protein